MPIIKSGYATAPPRNGSTRAHRKLRAITLSEETRCVICGKGDLDNDPWVAAHIIAHAYGGPTTRSNYRKAHQSCNLKHGALPIAQRNEGGV